MKRWYTSISILLVVLISVMGVLMAGLMLLLVPRPPDVLRAMLRRMVTARTFHVETQLSWRGTSGPASAKKDDVYSVESKGDVDLRDPVTARGAHDFVAMLGTLRFAGAYRRSGDAHVYRFSDLPARIGGVTFSTLRDKWLRVDHDEVARRFDLPVLGGGRRDLTAEERTAFAKGLVAVPWVVVDEYVNTERIDGVPVYHYKVSFEPLFIKDLAMRVESAKLGRELTAKERSWFDTFFADLVLEPGEVWIGTKDDILYRTRLRARYDDGKRTGVLDVAASFTQVDTAATATSPTDGVTDVTPVILSFLPGLSGRLPLAADGALPRGATTSGSSLGGLSGSGTGADDPDGDGLPNALELFYGVDPADADSDDDGVSDGTEVSAGKNPAGPGNLFDFTGGQFR